MARNRRASLFTALASCGALGASSVAVSCFPKLSELSGLGGSISTSTASAMGGSSGNGGSDGGVDASTGGMQATSSSSTSSVGGSSTSISSSSGTGGGDGGMMTSCDAGLLCSGSCVDTTSDANNCGRCGHGCCGGQCMNSACTPRVISTGTAPGPPVVDAKYVYWADAQQSGDGGILRAPLSGGSPVSLAAFLDHPNSVAVDSSFVYWVTYSVTAPNYGGVFKVPVDGGATIPLVPTQQGATWVLVNSTNVYWDDHGDNEINRANLDGTDATIIAGMTQQVAGPLQMTLDATNLYWASRGNGQVQAGPLFGASVAMLSTGSDPIGVAVNSTAIFWANYGDGSIQKAPLPNGGTATLVAVSSGFGPNSIAVDESYVYWADLGEPGGKTVDGGQDGSIRAAPVTGTGAPGVVLASSENPSYLTLDASCIYWTDSLSGEVSVVAKP
jgi:hypothetical protein